MRKTTNVKVTALKAPWPQGVEVGSIVAFDGDVPGWARGKCEPAPEGEKAEFAYEPPAPPVQEGSAPVAKALDTVNAELDDLRKQLAAAQDANDKLAFEKQASEAALADFQKAHDAEVADLRKQLVEAAAAKGPKK